ncbi:hypothetical protein PG995_014274 [Apiospora arundinis]
MPLALTACHWQESNCGCPHLCHNINCRTSAFQHSDVKCSAVCNTGITGISTGITGITTFWTVLGYILAAYGGLNLLWKAIESEEDGSHKPETPAAPAEPAEPESLAPERDQYQ